MRLLAIDTATEACSAALLVDGAVSERHEVAPRRHGELILPMVQTLLAEAQLHAADLDGVVLGRGPGAFTGLRIGCGVVQGLAFAADLPVAPVSTLAALAQGGWRETGCERIAAAIDARMGEVYLAHFRVEAGLVVIEGEERVVAPDQVELPTDGWCGCGTGWAAADGAMATRNRDRLITVLPQALPRARDLLPLGEAQLKAGLGVVAEAALPVYVRNEVAWKKAT